MIKKIKRLRKKMDNNKFKAEEEDLEEVVNPVETNQKEETNPNPETSETTETKEKIVKINSQVKMMNILIAIKK